MANALTGKDLSPCNRAVRVLSVERSDHRIFVLAESEALARCPTCGSLSRSRHSRYWRTLKDLPVQGFPVVIRLQLSRWRCRNPECSKSVFTQRLPSVAVPHARRTLRFDEVVLLAGHALGGRPAEKLMSRLGMAVSDDTLLRLVRRSATGVANVLRVVGVDDWAWKKQYNYGTILVDLERGETVDLLPGRSADELAAWLKQHPDIEIVSRDRNGLYADGVARGAPQAQQVADRFHLMFNLRQAVEGELSRERKSLILPLLGAGAHCPKPDTSVVSAVEVTKEPATAAPAPENDPPLASGAVRHRRQLAVERRSAKQELFDTVRRLHLSGKRVSQIARETGMQRRRVDKWIRLTELPERNKMEPRPSSPAYFGDYLERRWEEGCHHGRTLMREIQARGYTGCFSGLAHFLSGWRQPGSALRRRKRVEISAEKSAGNEVGIEVAPEPDLSVATGGRHVSPLVAAALLMKPGPHLAARQREKVDALKLVCPGFASMRSLVMSFRGILLGGKQESLEPWMAKAAQSGIYGLKRFVQGLRKDLKAVKNAISESWSNGPVEGHVNRLKTLKRQMYGRAGFALLRARLLPVPLQSPFSLHQL